MDQHIDIATDKAGPPAELLATEWLLTNGRGSYASSTVTGTNTRKYHGLLVAAVRPPGERAVLLSALADEIEVAGRSYPLACFEFDRLFHPRGDRHLARFERDSLDGTVRFVWRFDGFAVSKSIVLARDADALAVRYQIEGAAPASATLRVSPLLAYRHYHANRHADGEPAVLAEWEGGMFRLIDGHGRLPALRIAAATGRFNAAGDWWYRFHFRTEAERGEHPWEDLYCPGQFELVFDGDGRSELQIAAEPFHTVSFDEAAAGQRAHRQALLKLTPLAEKSSPTDRPATEQLLLSADDFIVHVPRRGQSPNTPPEGVWSILAGYHWFADWGRDAFISLPGLLLTTGRAELAHGVLARFAGAIRAGLVPNRFSDDPVSGLGEPCDYNSVDASLWFIHAAFAWADATGRWDDFDRELLTPVTHILDAYHAGTDYDIRVDGDGLLACGRHGTQLTWMDAMVDNVPITPRLGKPVEVNALYGHNLSRTADRLDQLGANDRAETYRRRYGAWRESFLSRFPSRRGGLCDRIDPSGQCDELIRPNQLLAVSLGGDLLPHDLARQVVEVCRERLLTPVGLRTLAPGEPGYRGRCTGGRHERDGAYHQGTAWAWLIGPFLEAHLRVNDFSDGARRQARQWLSPLVAHFAQAGLGQISEIFDGDAPHTPRGCVAQAWSVAETLRLWAMLQS